MVAGPEGCICGGDQLAVSVPLSAPEDSQDLWRLSPGSLPASDWLIMDQSPPRQGFLMNNCQRGRVVAWPHQTLTDLSSATSSVASLCLSAGRDTSLPPLLNYTHNCYRQQTAHYILEGTLVWGLER